MFWKLHPYSYGHCSRVSIYNIEEDRTNSKDAQLNLMHSLPFKHDPVTDIFGLDGYLFICLGNVISAYQVTKTGEKTFEANSVFKLNTEKVRVFGRS